eukprot:TRINITY_DN211_c0_g1::TRINITY_DN211_c0_g1_i1::g.1613::m.1613 TRINITY_DN211_c0_g1::TRINITY_DN211_c0_g1_i1::g.1613  ORF type:complete len:442 (+),score=24.63,sp/F4ILY9/AVT3B_ARATH/29.93/9e-38,Aa_trans/PF01490.13/3.2e-59 TRINITY_DN211_c0_g1_i1:82-1407(+)
MGDEAAFSLEPTRCYSEVDIPDSSEPLFPVTKPYAVDDDENDIAPLSSHWQSFVTTFKAAVGAGVVALPYAFKQAGLLPGSIGLLLVYAASNYTMRQIVQCIRIVRTRKLESFDLIHEPRMDLGYAEVGQEALGSWGRFASYFSLISCQFVAVCSYLIFISENLSEVFQVPRQTIVLMCFPFILPMALAKNTTYLAPTSTFGNLSVTIAVLTVFYYGFKHSPPSLDHVELTNGIAGLPDFFGVVVFTFSAHCEIIPIEFDAGDKPGYYRVLDYAIFCVAVLYGSVASIGYLCFGEDTHAIIFKDLGSGAVANFVKVTMSISILFNYPLSLLPATNMLDGMLLDADNTPHRLYRRQKRILRAIVVILSCIVAVSTERFGAVTTLAGGFNGFLAFVLPPIFYVSLKGRKNCSIGELALNSTLVVLGLIGSIASVVIGVKESVF